MLGEEAVDREDARFDAAARATQAPHPHRERIYGLHDQHDHRPRSHAGVVVLLGSRLLLHTTRPYRKETEVRTPHLREKGTPHSCFLVVWSRHTVCIM